MKSPAKTALAVSLASGLALFLAATPAHAANLLVGGYSLSTYASGLPVDFILTGMTMDRATRQMFYMGGGTSNLHRLDPGGAVTTLAALGNFYPYIDTDIEYYNGSVFIPNAGGNIIKMSGTAPTSTRLATPVSIVFTQGIARVGSNLYVTSQTNGGPTEILIVDPISGAVSFPNLTVPTGSVSSLEYDPVHNRLIFASVGFQTIDLATKTFGPAFGVGVTAFENFSVDPTGTSIFTRSGDTLFQIDIATGSVNPFVNGLYDNGGGAGIEDTVFGPSSSGSGQSLYIADGDAIREVSGFAPVPEPATFFTAVIGAVGLAGFRRRRNVNV